VIKTHTPLDGLSLDARVRYIVVARHPLDAAVSLYWQSQNLDRERVRQLTGQPEGRGVEQPLPDWLRGWVEDDADPRTSLDSLAGVMHHIADAWGRRESLNVSLVHYHDLSVDLNRTMQELASYLEVDAPQQNWSEMVAAASFDQMRADADRLAPDTQGILKSRAAFFRRAGLGEGWALLDSAHQRRYIERLTDLGSRDLARWMNRPGAVASA
jgi:aryl sulfotransferase